MSPVFRRENGYSFKIYSNEDDRMHIHVLKAGNEAKFWLEPSIEVAENNGFADFELNKIKRIVENYGNEFKEQFRRHVCKRIDD